MAERRRARSSSISLAPSCQDRRGNNAISYVTTLRHEDGSIGFLDFDGKVRPPDPGFVVSPEQPEYPPGTKGPRIRGVALRSEKLDLRAGCSSRMPSAQPDERCRTSTPAGLRHRDGVAGQPAVAVARRKPDSSIASRDLLHGARERAAFTRPSKRASTARALVSIIRAHASKEGRAVVVRLAMTSADRR
jgi:hypothetical protein